MHGLKVALKGADGMKKIMVVEDDPKISAYLQSYIAKYNYEVVEVKDFEHIIDLFKDESPDLVLLDINLPYYDGFYWCRQIRQHSICPVIFISARDRKSTRLNSSHVAISYAVFCLKKKKKYKNHIQAVNTKQYM